MAYIGAGISRFNTADELTVTGTSEFGGNVSFGDNNITNVGSLQIDSIAGDADTNTNITFAGSDVITMTTAGSERLRLDASGNVGIGTSSPDHNLTLQANTSPIFEMVQVAGGPYKHQIAVGGNDLQLRASSGALIMYTGNADGASSTERMRLDSNGNLLVGKTSADGGVAAGHDIRATGLSYQTVDGGAVTVLNRLTSDGDIALFRKDGTTVGVIGTQNWGIGTASPAHNLEIVATAAGSVNDSLQIRNNATSTGTGSRIRFINSTDANSDANGASIASVRNGNDNDLVFETENSEAMRIDHSGNVGIGTSSPDSNLKIKSTGAATLRIDGGAVAASVGPLIVGEHNDADAFYIGTNSVVLGESSNQDVVIYGADSSSGNIRFYAGASTETARIRDGGGITFNGDTAAANALDDYEEGTWTPSVRGSTTNGSFAGSNTTGFYTKIGDTVHAWFDCDGTISGAAGIIIFTGLPYASISTVEAVGQFMFSDLNTVDATRTNHVLYLGGNATEMSIFASKDDAAWVQVDITNESIGIRAQITYKTA